MCSIFPKGGTPLFDLFSQNSHFQLSLDIQIQYYWKAYWINLMVVNLCELFTGCSRINIDSKYFNKMWLLVKYFLLVVM